MEKYDIVIIGGGFCGVLCAKILERKSNLSIALFDRKPNFEFIPAIPKLVINKEHSRKISIPFLRIFKKTKFFLDEVINVTKDTVQGKSKQISYKYLVICSGSDYPIELKNKKNVHTLKYVNEGLAINKDVHKNDNVLIIGGGLAGTEIAAEIATRTNKRVTLIHSKNRLIERNPEKASNYAYNFLVNKGVVIKFNERVTEHMEDYFKTGNGNKYFYKMAVWCAGVSFKIPFLDKNDFPHCKDKEGHLIDSEYLFVKPHKNIFAGGDVANTKEEKTAQNADRHAKLIANNIICLEKGKELKKYKPRTGPLVISLGPWNGLLVAGNFVISGLIPGIMKHLIEMAVMFRIKNL